MDATLQFAIFAGVLILFMALEFIAPRRALSRTRVQRWSANFILMITGALVSRALLFVGLIAASVWAGGQGIGLLNMIAVPSGLAIIMTIIIMDFAIWAQHVAMHYVPVLWRMHRVHHTDVDLDATSGVRFHPLEISVSLLYKSAVVIALGAPVFAVMLYMAILSAMSVFTHANVKIAEPVDRILRLIFITPDFHRVHHSVHMDETNSNYGNFLSIWDRIFKTYRADLRDGQTTAQLGLHEFRAETDQGPWTLLAQPFRRASDRRQ